MMARKGACRAIATGITGTALRRSTTTNSRQDSTETPRSPTSAGLRHPAPVAVVSAATSATNPTVTAVWLATLVRPTARVGVSETVHATSTAVSAANGTTTQNTARQPTE